ncbi:hypothetical protein FLK61_35160 [Paenalkalicoccus suaedae]|uniref:Uncharacterized protein n=1 Tax=Paenalkalicoccus suaedae TaxID=2592382 RepID=A0A859FFJ4_9BACI|nr:hypothetical protein [Paenalkalicoccus suaedae]QKS71909.1 hypothetical protein FLK61_35160 [Paenalkalicoccus suaedae]
MEVNLKYEAIVNGVRRKAGSTVNVSEEVLDKLVASGVIESKAEAMKNLTFETTSQQPTETKLSYEHVGGGYYVIKREGEEIDRVRGKEALEKRLKEG